MSPAPCSRSSTGCRAAHGFSVKRVVIGRFCVEKVSRGVSEGLWQHAYFSTALTSPQHSVVFLYASRPLSAAASSFNPRARQKALLQLGSPYAVSVVEIEAWRERVLLASQCPQHGMTTTKARCREHCVQSSKRKWVYMLSTLALRSPSACDTHCRCGRELPAERYQRERRHGWRLLCHSGCRGVNPRLTRSLKKGLLPGVYLNLPTVKSLCVEKYRSYLKSAAERSSENLSTLSARPHEHRNIMDSCCRHTTPCGRGYRPRQQARFPSKPVLYATRGRRPRTQSPCRGTLTVTKCFEVVDYGGKPGIIVDSKSDTHFRGRHRNVDACVRWFSNVSKTLL